ncbi:MAG TPA: cytochrome c-type biogenesis protein [Methylocella sp.]|nr:cytochrome c-type biogenesis protein [Methylocella sp.]
MQGLLRRSTLERFPSPIKLGKALALVSLLWLSPLPALAVQPDEVLSDPKLEARARGLSAELRCMVCQNESIDDSSADLARDLRLLVRERLKAGDSDAQIRAFLTARYGDFILLKPPFKPETWLLWTAPLLVLLTGAGLILLARRRQSRQASDVAVSAPSLSENERARLEALVGKEEGQ